MFILVSFILFYLLAIFSTGEKPESQRKLLIITCVILAFLAGNRDFYKWPDTLVYLNTFWEKTDDLFNFSFSNTISAYNEHGFRLLTSFVRTFTDSGTIYLLVVSSITFFVLYNCFHKYCVFPLLGVCDYIARFYIGRDFVQIRQSLAIAIIFFAIQYVYTKDWKRYYVYILIAYLFHKSSVVAVPFYFFSFFRYKKWHVVLGIILAFIAAATLAPAIESTVDGWSSDLNYEMYSMDYHKRKELGLRNPLIYLQIFLLLYLTFFEKKLSHLSPYYFVFRNAYFYSTLILILFCQYIELSGRTSTIFATVETAIVPLLAMSFKKSERLIFYVLSAIAMIYFFFLKTEFIE